MSKASSKVAGPQNNLFTIFIVLTGLLVIGLVVFVNQQDPQPETSVNITAQGGSETDADADADVETSDDENINEIRESLNKNENANIVENINNENTNSNTTTSDYGITLKQPATVNSEGDIYTYQFGGGNIVNVMPLEFEGLVLNESSVIDRQPINLGSVTGEKITIESAKDGSAVMIIHVKTNQYLYDMRGSDQFINNITNYINF